MDHDPVDEFSLVAEAEAPTPVVTINEKGSGAVLRTAAGIGVPFYKAKDGSWGIPFSAGISVLFEGDRKIVDELERIWAQGLADGILTPSPASRGRSEGRASRIRRVGEFADHALIHTSYCGKESVIEFDLERGGFIDRDTRKKAPLWAQLDAASFLIGEALKSLIPARARERKA
jgi:hypothetical protein